MNKSGAPGWRTCARRLLKNRRDAIALAPNKLYELKELCLQPKVFLVKQSPLVKRQDSKFVPSKMLTRASYTLDQVSGTLSTDAEGRLTFIEKSGFDFQPVTVQLPRWGAGTDAVYHQRSGGSDPHRHEQ